MLKNFKKFLLFLKKNDYSNQTIYSYKRDLKTFEGFLEYERINFNNINESHIDRYREYLFSEARSTSNKKDLEKRLSTSSVNRALSSLKAYLDYLDNNNYHAPLLSNKVKLVKNIKKHAKIPEFDELVRLIEVPSKIEKNPIIGARNRAIFEVLFSTGMRISELVSLTRNQIDNTGRIFILGKGKKERFVYLTERSKKYLDAYLKIRKDNLKALFVPLRGRNVSKKNMRISTNYIQYRIKFYREYLGINIPISAHTLRHGFATYLAENGASPAAIQILLGHESLDTTTRYVHASDRFAEKVHKEFHPLK